MSDSKETAEGRQTAPNCCKICGDSAGCGVNFGCLSCESCKAFFRRCSVRLQSLKCPFSGHCRITKASRRACQACRLAKCVRNGMRKELVDMWKKMRKKTTEIENGREGNIEEKVNGKKKGREEKGNCCKCKSWKRKQTEEKGTQTEKEMPKVAKECRPSAAVFGFSPKTFGDCPLVENAQQTLLNELVRANAVLDAPLRVPNQQTMLFNLTLVDALRVCELAMRRMVAMCKQLGTFRALPQSDQISLLRAGLVQLLILRGAMAFDPVNEVWRHAMLVGSGSGGPLPFMLNLNWRTDRTVMLTLQAMVLFCPQADPLEAREVIRTQRERYCELLKRHLDGVTKSAQKAESAFVHLMAKLDELVTLNNSFHLIYMQLNQSELEPLFREIFTAK
ncbi:hypothetical protein niasHT_003950 [Heterodera trifolii]|uniref:Uncharacterized protein n=1 Tax=Heterodera trifolii TaxID=157864 RepID=A0ABD2LV85_9BILA